MTKAFAMGLALAFTTLGCAMDQKKEMHTLKDPAPVDCSTGQADIDVLKTEKANVAERMVEGVTSVVPAGAVLGILLGTEVTKMEVAVGHYNKVIDERIAQIKAECGI